MLLGPQPSLNTHQARMNRSTLGQWDWYALHRARIEQLIVPNKTGQTLCVLGAGNCNDLDLEWLTRVYANVHLVDLDGTALESARDRQFKSQPPNLHLHAPVDLTSIAHTIATWKGREVPVEEVDAAIATVNRNTIPLQLTNLIGHCDLVVSPCILSQIWVATRDLLGSAHPRWKSIKASLLHQHLRQINSLLKSGARGVKIVDLASTSVVRHLDQAKPHEWQSLMQLCITEGRCFRGLEPQALQSALRAQGITTPIQIIPPWLWHLGFAKSFLCFAMTWTR